jgi:hypothetical protein
MKIFGDPKHLIIGTKIDLVKRTGDQRRADVRLLAQKPMTVLRNRQKRVQEAISSASKGYYMAIEKGRPEKVLEFGMKRTILREQERDLENAIGLKVITAPGFKAR